MAKSLRREIEEYFALKIGDGAFPLSGFHGEYRAWVIKNGAEYGVFIPYNGDDISEFFAGATLKSDVKVIGETETIKVLMLTCHEWALRNEFSLICEDFVELGEHDKNRKTLLKDPVAWWQKWTALLGNAQGTKYIFDIVAELSALVKLYELGENPFWSATGLNTHDIETDKESYEVKATLSKSKSVIHVSSQFQFLEGKPLFLIFSRLEESKLGKSIDDLLKIVETYDKNMVMSYNNYLYEKGYAKGNHNRKKKYVILERRKIEVTDTFPKVTEAQFIGGKMPDNISHLEYDVSIDGLLFENWK